AMPKPTTHIIDWFHIAMKIQPMQQIADHIARSQPSPIEALPTIDRDIRAVKWRLWHGRLDRAIRDLERLLAKLQGSPQVSGDIDAAERVELDLPETGVCSTPADTSGAGCCGSQVAAPLEETSGGCGYCRGRRRGADQPRDCRWRSGADRSRGHKL
ncbi:MAG: hypothetical protein ABIH17_09920, partial [Pseudomonadota bacterium]